MNIKHRLDRETVFFLTAGILTGVVLTSLFTGGMMTDNGEESAQELIDTLETSSGQELELVNLEEQNGLYRAQIKDQNDQLSTYYITKNGELIMQESGVTNLRQFSQRVNAQSEFTGCMEEKEVMMYGNVSQQETSAQIQLLGGPNMVSGIYSDINEQQNLAEAINRGVQRIPAFYYENSTLQGVQSIGNLENFTGCNYSGPEQ